MRTATVNHVSNLAVRRIVCGLIAASMIFVGRPAVADRRDDDRRDDDRSERSERSERGERSDRGGRSEGGDRSRWSERSRGGDRSKSSERSQSLDRMKAFQRSEPSAGASSGGGLPTFDEIAEYVEATLESKKDYEKGDLITQSDVAAIIARLEQAGLPVRVKQDGFDPLLPDSHKLVAVLRTKEGAAFVRQLKNSDVLDRMARLAEFAEGLDLVQKIVASGDVKYALLLDDQQVCQDLEAKYFGNPSMANFAVLSGKAYDSDQFLEHLELLYDLTVNNIARPVE